MFYEYAKIRRMAKEVQSVADTIRDASAHQICNARNMTEQDLRGETANKITSCLTELNQDLGDLTSSLSSIASELLLYAHRVEEADRLSREKIREK